MIEKIKRVLRHNQALALAVVVCIALGVYLVGCESSVTSPINPPKKVTRVQLDAEVERLIVDIDLAIEDLNKQDLFKQKLFEIGLAAAQGGTINPVGAGVTLLGILGLGAVADNRKKDSIIKTLQREEK
jgi:hypothetical protein